MALTKKWAIMVIDFDSFAVEHNFRLMRIARQTLTFRTKEDAEEFLQLTYKKKDLDLEYTIIEIYSIS